MAACCRILWLSGRPERRHPAKGELRALHPHKLNDCAYTTQILSQFHWSTRACSTLTVPGQGKATMLLHLDRAGNVRMRGTRCWCAGLAQSGRSAETLHCARGGDVVRRHAAPKIHQVVCGKVLHDPKRVLPRTARARTLLQTAPRRNIDADRRLSAALLTVRLGCESETASSPIVQSSWHGLRAPGSRRILAIPNYFAAYDTRTCFRLYSLQMSPFYPSCAIHRIIP